ncbi:PROTEASE FAMILY M14 CARBOXYPEPTIDASE AB [Salix viminalis]|uniref:PROTEASE FAMILY M14 CARBOXYPEPTIDASE AB n=1 Tax=Salix viminalis TaxID=40686 RepID=A0A9Q0UUZ2_SALVM|nr:PROTEASE FAMILY M14 CARBOXYPEPTIDASE AB [Salix viminalis]
MAYLLSFLIFASLSLVNAKSNSTLTPINRDLYHSSADLLEEIKALVHRHPDKLTVETIKTGNKGYKAEITVVTYCRSRKETDDRSKFRILLSFGQHGRELITTELAFRILSILSEEQFLPDVDAASLNNTLDKLVIKVVPMENVNGRKLVEGGDLCERRNGRGVDLNRNWSVDWGKKEKDYDPYEENPGTGPFSEPETQIMRKLALTFDPHIWVNVHSGMEALFMPYDHRNTTPDGAPSEQMRSLLSKLNNVHFHKHCIIGSGGGSVGALPTSYTHRHTIGFVIWPFSSSRLSVGTSCILHMGTATDFMYEVVKVPMAFTFEIYGDTTASSKDCFKMFNPVDVTTFHRVLNDWSSSFFTIFKLGPYQLDGNSSKAMASSSEKFVSIDEYLDGYLVERRNRYGKKMEVLDVGMQEIRTYFRLFLLSSVLLLFMFCSRIARSKSSRPIVSALPI